MPPDGNRAGDGDGRVCSRNRADEEGEREAAKNFAAEDDERENREEYKPVGNDCARHRLIDRIIDQIVERLIAVQRQVFTDAVENNDRVVYRETDERQQRC